MKIILALLFYMTAYTSIAQKENPLGFFFATGFQTSFNTAKVYHKLPKGQGVANYTFNNTEYGGGDVPVIMGLNFKKLKTSIMGYNLLKPFQKFKKYNLYQYNLNYKFSKNKYNKINISAGGSLFLLTHANYYYETEPNEGFYGINFELSLKQFSFMASFGLPLQKNSYLDHYKVGYKTNSLITLQLTYEFYPFRKKGKASLEK